MFRQVGIGAATVLSIGLLAAGCSEDGDTIIAGGGSNLSNTDSTPFSGITLNNLASDGGGFTGNGGNVNDWRVVFNCNPSKSGASSSADGSALVLYKQTSAGKIRVFASSFEGGRLTPPVELEAQDRNYTVDVNLDAYVLLPLNTANYQSTNTTPATEVNDVRQQQGNWLIMGDYRTQFVQQGQEISSATSIGKGARTIVGSWVYLKSLRNQSMATSNKVGGITREFRYGFQRFADEVPTTHTAGGLDNTSTTVTGNGFAPPNHVVSYGVVTDGLASQAQFGGQGTPHNGNFSNGLSAFTRGGVTNQTMTPVFDTARYTVGDDVSVIAAVYAQIETSLSSDNNDMRPSVLNNDSTSGGQAFMRYRAFNIATLSWGTEARLSTGIDSNDNSEGSVAGEGVFPDFQVYNNTLFFRYMDASQDGAQGTVTGSNFQNYKNIRANRAMIAAVRFNDAQNGSLTVGTPIDISTDAICVTNTGAAGTPGAHTITQQTGATGILNPSYENANWIAYNGGTQTQSIYGPDEGLEEISLFYTLADGTASGTGTTGSNVNSDAELTVVVLPAANTLTAANTFPTALGTNPFRISGNHATDDQLRTSPSTTTNVSLADGVDKVRFVMNRTGRWIAVAFTREEGVGENSAWARNAYVNIYQPFRLVTSSTGGAAGGTAATVQTRFLAAGPTKINGAISILAKGQPGADGTNGTPDNNGNSLPVNRIGFQDGVCYRGLQSNANVVSLFYEQSDATGDRVFGAQLTVQLSTANNPATAPQLTAASAVELDLGTDVVGQAAFHLANAGAGTTSFKWIDGNGQIDDSDFFRTVDAGGNLGSTTATNGNVLIAFARVDDATTNDSSGTKDLGDIGLYATVFTGTAFETPVKIGTTADTNEALNANAGFGGGRAIAAGAYTNILNTINNSVQIRRLLPMYARDTNITANPNYPTNATTGYFAVILRDREASLNTASGSTTTTVVGGNSSSRLAVYARRISMVNSAANPSVTTLAERTFPSVINTNTSPFALPIQLDHAQGVSTDGDLVDECSNGTSLGVVLLVDNQLWYQATQDGENWLKDAATGLANPGLISNFSSSDVLNAPFPELFCCEGDNGQATGSQILLFAKKDIAGTDRGFAATRN